MQDTLTWFDRSGLEITPQGDFQVTFWGGDPYTEQSSGDFQANVTVSISETVKGAPQGFKKVSALFTIDMDNNLGNGGKYWSSAFDRYTGTSFEFDNAISYTLNGENSSRKGFASLQDGLEYCDVLIEEGENNRYPLIYRTITVICPESYDGTVFQIGYSSPELSMKNRKIDYSTRLYKIDELPFYGSRYLYFSLTDK